MDASVRITLFRHQLRVYCQPLEHLLRYCARPPFALERLSVIRGEDGRIARVRYVLPRHKSANWVGPGRGRKSTRPGANGVVELSPFVFLDRLSDLVPPRKHRHRYHGVFAPNHKLRPAVTALAKRECRQAARCRDWWACGRRTCGGRKSHQRLLRLMRQTAFSRHLAHKPGRRAARDRHPQPLTAFHATVRTAREKSGFKAGLRQREKSGLECG